MLAYTKRLIKMILGFALLLAGIIMLVTPGPGWAAIFAGLVLLASEFAWAHRLLEYLKARFRQLRDAALRSDKKQAGAGSAGSDSAPPSAK